MAFDNTNSGMMARNENRKSDKHPEFTGSINVNGVDYWLSAWVNEGKPGGKLEGKKYFSIKLNPKEQRAPTPAPNAGGVMTYDDYRRSRDGDISDDIPF
jgi:hypothetical protein